MAFEGEGHLGFRVGRIDDGHGFVRRGAAERRTDASARAFRQRRGADRLRMEQPTGIDAD